MTIKEKIITVVIFAGLTALAIWIVYLLTT